MSNTLFCKFSSRKIHLEYTRLTTAAPVSVIQNDNFNSQTARLTSWRQVFSFTAGVVLGLLLAMIIRKCILGSLQFCLVTDRATIVKLSENPFNIIGGDLEKFPHNSDNNLLFVGVMTAQQYLDTRAVSVFETWAQHIPGKIAFFTSGSSISSSKIPIIPLEGVDDSYPPQKKSFMMLKYMHDHFIDHFEFFMRADDDLYVRPDKLEKFLRSVNSSQLQFIGQTGKGNSDEFGRLSLLDYENFCMGGPGVILSRATLARVAPHIKDCLHNMHTSHEDVELGRCVQRFAGIPCTWSYEMRHILYHNSSGSEAFTGVLKQPELHHAITLHPIKNYTHLYRLHHYLQVVQAISLETEVLQLMRELGQLHRRRAHHRLPLPHLDDVGAGVFFSHLGRPAGLHVAPPGRQRSLTPFSLLLGKLQFSLDAANPRHRLPSHLNESLADVVAHTMDVVNSPSKARGRSLDYRSLLYGYSRVSPGAGLQLVLDMLLLYRRYRGNRITMPVRRHGYLQVPFGALYVRELPTPSTEERTLLEPTTPHARAESPPSSAEDKVEDATIHFLLPLAGRRQAFIRFLNNYERVVLQGEETATLTIVHYPDHDTDSDDDDDGDGELNRVGGEGESGARDDADGTGDDSRSPHWLVKGLRLRHPAARVHTVQVPGQFSRAAALTLGAAQWPDPDALLFCVDVDMAFGADLLARIRLHTRRGVQVYFPIVFSEFDPSVVGAQHWGSDDLTPVTEESGYFRNFGFGIVSVYAGDLRDVGGFNTSIKGWGGEDVDLYDKVVLSPRLLVFRACEPSLVHVYHRPSCALTVSPQDGLSPSSNQAAMCAGSVYSTHASTAALARRLLAQPAILNAAAALSRSGG